MNDNAVRCQNASVTEPQRDPIPTGMVEFQAAPCVVILEQASSSRFFATLENDSEEDAPRRISQGVRGDKAKSTYNSMI